MSNTEKALRDMTDEGAFERLATAILRESTPMYAALIHTGVNADGKTIKSPLDAVSFVQNADPPHMIAVHHTTTDRDDLTKKWLHDPSKVKPQKRTGKGPTAPAGDLLKTAELANKERLRRPDLVVTLVLTTNEEPTEQLIRDVEKDGVDKGLKIDLWTRSRLCAFLDNHPTGQWLRYLHLGIDQELLSKELLHDLCRKNLEASPPPDDPEAWIDRQIDSMLLENNRDVTFLVARSGLGKTVACFRKLFKHVASGGFGLVLSHKVIESSSTIEQAITQTLKQLHPVLANASVSALSFCMPESPLLLLVEDVNRCGQTLALTEKLASWSQRWTRPSDKTPLSWRLICPLWPEVLSSLNDVSRKRFEPLFQYIDGFKENEGRDAVLARAKLHNREISASNADLISRGLGHDPLLIALYDPTMTLEPRETINQFAEGAISRAATIAKEYAPGDFRQSLRALAGAMLEKRQIDILWREAKTWAGLQGESLLLVSRLAHHGELIRFTGTSDEQMLSFRHDRVRDWILSDAIMDLVHRNLLADDVLSEPYFAELIGTVLADDKHHADFLPRAASRNPLSLFQALRLLGHSEVPQREAIIELINKWLGDPETHENSNCELRYAALSMLAETDSSVVPLIARQFRDQTTSRDMALFRNGDIAGGISLCAYLEPGC